MDIGLAGELTLRQVQLQLDDLDADQLRECLALTWEAWLLERATVREKVREMTGLDVQVSCRNFLPKEIVGVA